MTLDHISVSPEDSPSLVSNHISDDSSSVTSDHSSDQSGDMSSKSHSQRSRHTPDPMSISLEETFSSVPIEFSFMAVDVSLSLPRVYSSEQPADMLSKTYSEEVGSILSVKSSSLGIIKHHPIAVDDSLTLPSVNSLQQQDVIPLQLLCPQLSPTFMLLITSPVVLSNGQK